MTREGNHGTPPALELLTRKNVLAGLLFMGVAIAGLWISRDYPIGTTLRMGTGYVPRLLCWILLALGCLVLVQGLREAAQRGDAHARLAWRPLVFVAGSLALFGLALERLGLVLSILLLIGVAGETIVAALALIALSWGIFIFGLNLTIRVWPEW
jgi:hypothetical protein